MKLALLYSSILLFAPCSATAQERSEAFALGELSDELFECSSWFEASAVCISNNEQPERAALILKLKQSSTIVGSVGVAIDQKLGKSEKAIGASLELSTKRIMALMKNSCINISVAIVRYNEFCARLRNDVSWRLAEILAGKKCTGSYDCSD